MADNRHKYGFRFYSSASGSGRPVGVEAFVASAYQANVGGGSTNVGISIGDPVDRLSTGFVELSNDTATRDTLWGVVAAISNAKVGLNNKAQPAAYLPGATSFGTTETETRLIVLPFGDNIWEIDVDDIVTATSLATYRALVGENADFVFSPDVSDANRPRANPVLDISTHATTAALHFRIVGVSKTAENQDYSGANVKLLVQLNQGIDPILNGATGMAGV